MQAIMGKKSPPQKAIISTGFGIAQAFNIVHIVWGGLSLHNCQSLAKQLKDHRLLTGFVIT
jgi:hypothetical protein